MRRDPGSFAGMEGDIYMLQSHFAEMFLWVSIPIMNLKKIISFKNTSNIVFSENFSYEKR